MSCTAYDKDCVRCPRLAAYLAEVRAERPDYWARPVASFGDKHARLLIVGLAPGLHGANRTGRPFTGDYAGELLYQTLHAFGWASKAASRHRRDGLKLTGARITNAVKCVPPANKPTTEEIDTCNDYLACELSRLPAGAVVLALGQIAHRAVLKALGQRLSAYPFGHGARHAPALTQPAGLTLVDSYHCSRYNTQTGRLTPAMFRKVFRDIDRLLQRGRS